MGWDVATQGCQGQYRDEDPISCLAVSWLKHKFIKRLWGSMLEGLLSIGNLWGTSDHGLPGVGGCWLRQFIFVWGTFLFFVLDPFHGRVYTHVVLCAFFLSRFFSVLTTSYDSKRIRVHTTRRIRLMPMVLKRRNEASLFRHEEWILNSCEIRNMPKSTMVRSVRPMMIKRKF